MARAFKNNYDHPLARFDNDLLYICTVAGIWAIDKPVYGLIHCITRQKKLFREPKDELFLEGILF